VKTGEGELSQTKEGQKTKLRRRKDSEISLKRDYKGNGKGKRERKRGLTCVRGALIFCIQK